MMTTSSKMPTLTRASARQTRLRRGATMRETRVAVVMRRGGREGGARAQKIVMKSEGSNVNPDIGV